MPSRTLRRDLLQGGDKVVYLALSGAKTEAHAHGTRYSGFLTPLHTSANSARLVIAYSEQLKDQRMGTEASVANPDPKLCAQNGGQLTVVVPRQIKCSNSNSCGLLVPQPVELKPRNATEAASGVVAQGDLFLSNAGHSILG
jgi:putative hemolysin